MNGNDLINMGYTPGKYFAELLAVGNSLEENEIPFAQIRVALDEIYEEATFKEKKIPLQSGAPMTVYLDCPDDGFERTNYDATVASMTEVIKTPTVRNSYIMPDACPTGSLGTIPVGGVVVAENAIHPGMHSADICCSMFLTSVSTDRPINDIMDAVQKRSHFGYGGRTDEMNLDANHAIITQAKNNRFLSNVRVIAAMSDHLGTQGDGNHFFYVGRKQSNGELTFVTHHGSRNPGAQLYKAGMKIAEEFRREISPDTLKQNAWIPFDTDEGREYWDALQIIREWTKHNHTVIQNAVMAELGIHEREITDRFWNEHNFVFKRGDMFWHAKGSTPVWGDHAHDADQNGRTIVPLNMGEPILLVTNNENNPSGFAPHGAGRNMSRTAFKNKMGDKTVEQAMNEEVGHIDARFYTGEPDISELPGAYKNADEVRRQIQLYELAHVVDTIEPLGSMMAGEQAKPWVNKKKTVTGG
jgi:tRNA-splicing ligase RtcB